MTTEKGPEDGGSMFIRNIGWLHGFISQKIELFIDRGVWNYIFKENKWKVEKINKHGASEFVFSKRIIQVNK
jgi:hypothetical protein